MCKKLIHLMLVIVLVLLADMANADITTDLIGYWKLDDNANDSSGNGYHGEEYGSPSYVPGIIGQAMEFNGSQSVYIEDFTGIQNQDEVTVCMWVKANRNTRNTGEDQVMWFTNEGSGSGVYGRVRFGINGDEWEWKHGDGGGNPNVDDGENPIILGEWTHLAGVRKNNDRLELFVNGISVEQTAFGVAGVAEPQASIGSERRSPTSVRSPFEGTIDEVRLYSRALSAADIQELFAFTGASPAFASNPDPADEQTDVPRDVVLAWTPGEFAPPINGHTVYLSESFNDVNDGIGGITQSANSYARPQRLDFNTTYYWRVDEVNAPPDSTVFKGNVWSFTTEPVSYAIDNVTATASSQVPDQGSENTVNGSGLVDQLHSTELSDMWLTSDSDTGPAWIQFDFEKAYKLHEMLVWNYNREGLNTIYGLKDVIIEHSTDGTNWTPLSDVPEFPKAPGTDNYEPSIVNIGNVIARYVKITANSNWIGGMFNQYGLSEVRFMAIPVSARKPSPDVGATDVAVDVTLGFRAGREAAKHDVYLSTDEQAVIDGTALVATVTGNSYSTSLDVDSTYYWRVDEVNDAETPTTWQGDIWNFTTPEYLVVDDFELYNDLHPDDPDSNRIFKTWIDGYENPEINGSIVGYDNSPFTEQTIVHGGNQSMPFFYSNTGGAAYSEAKRTFAVPQNWTKAGVQTLALYFYGTAGNTGQFYVKVNGFKVVSDVADIQQATWQPWNIELASFDVNLQNVTTLGIGIDGNGASGTLYFDDIRLYSYDRQLVTPLEPNNVGLAAHYKLDQDATDSSGNNNHGTLVGNPQWAAGKIGVALDFDGNDYVDFGNPSLLDFGTGSWSISTWINIPASTDNLTIFAKGGDDSGGIRYMLSMGETDAHKVTLTVDDNADKKQRIGSIVVDDGQWHHIVGMRDGNKLRVYVDGFQDGGTTELPDGYDLGGTSQANAYVGAVWNYEDSVLQKYFIGVIDDVRIYDYTLSHAEVAWLAGMTEPFDKPF